MPPDRIHARMTRTRTILPALGVAIVTWAANASGQGIPFSQHGDVTQRVAFTDISISYNRPTARGRVIYGDSGIVRWGGTWHPGADSATRLTISRAVTFEGQPLAAGSYSVWTIPRREGPWTVMLNSRAHVFHTPYPGAATEVLRVDVTPERGPHMESLAWYFPVVARDSTVLRLHWGEIMIPMRIRVSTDP
jgi:hypothetical protein